MSASRNSFIIFSAFFLFTTLVAFRANAQVSNLLEELACGACHGGVTFTTNIREKFPSLSYAGLRYNPAYVFAYLGNPENIRKHVGKARMPDFFLDERERLAVTLFLIQQKTLHRPLPRFPDELARSFKPKKTFDARKLLVEELKCTACHKLDGKGADLAVDLSSVGARLNVEWLGQYLVMPQAFDPLSPMPAQAYTLSQAGNSLEEVLPNAGEKIVALVRYLKELANNEGQRLEIQFEKAKRNNRDISAKFGEQIFASLNCAGCHETGSMKPWKNGPDLSLESSRVKGDWLRSYLKKPKPIRPFGFFPGTGSRMPDFRLSSEDADSIAGQLLRHSGISYEPFPAFSLSPFAAKKVTTLLRDKLPCLGCHQLEGEGGKIAPDLSGVAQRLKPGFMAAMIRDPQHSVPGTLMPKTPMSEGTLRLLVSYFSSRETNVDTATYLPLTDFPLTSPREGSEPSQLYARFCSPCHGSDGKGDGFNSKFLSTKPSSHSSKSFMSARADDTIFDGIHNGGAMLGKNNRMPMFGQTLTRGQIHSLVKYIRQLCNCDGPKWSNVRSK